MLGSSIPEPTPIFPFTLNTVVGELHTTRLGAVAQRGIMAMADRERSRMLDGTSDPVVEKLTQRMIAEAPLRLLVSMSGRPGTRGAFDGLTKFLSMLRLGSRRG